MRRLSSLLLVTGFATLVAAAGCGGDDDDATGTTKGGTSGGSAKGGGSGSSVKGGSSGKGGSAGQVGVAGKGGSSGSGGSLSRGGRAGGATRGGASQGGSGGSTSGEAGTGAIGGSSEAGSNAGGNAGVEAGAGGSSGEGYGIDPLCGTIDPEATVTSHLIVTADNEAVVYVNGTNVGSTSSWSSAVTIDVSLYLYPGRENVVAIVGTNTSSQGGNDRGIVGQLTVEGLSGTVPILVTDATWRVSATEVLGWSDPSFNDSSWIFATELGAMGVSPWGNIIPDSTAKWIWSAAVPDSTSDKPNLESAYARRKFYLGLDGTTTTATPSCPEP